MNKKKKIQLNRQWFFCAIEKKRRYIDVECMLVLAPIYITCFELQKLFSILHTKTFRRSLFNFLVTSFS